MTLEDEIEAAFRHALANGDTLEAASDRATEGIEYMFNMGSGVGRDTAIQLAPIVKRVRAKLERERN